MLTASGLRDGASFLACQRLPAGFRLHGSKCADSAGSKGNGYFWLSKRSQTEREARARGDKMYLCSLAVRRWFSCRGAGDGWSGSKEATGWIQRDLKVIKLCWLSAAHRGALFSMFLLTWCFCQSVFSPQNPFSSWHLIHREDGLHKIEATPVREMSLSGSFAHLYHYSELKFVWNFFFIPFVKLYLEESLLVCLQFAYLKNLSPIYFTLGRLVDECTVK